MFDYSVYVIGPMEGGPVKVGYAKSPARRASELQCGNPKQLVVWHQTDYLSLDEARGLERGAHHALREHRMRGEWFDVDIEEAICAVTYYIKTQIYAARILMRFDTRKFITPENRDKIYQVALRTMVSNGVQEGAVG